MAASSPSPTQIIDTALFCNSTSAFALSYTYPDQKWLIRDHLTTLFQDYPSLRPSIDTFTHNDGTTVNLLNAGGKLNIPHSSPAPPVSLKIWLHENYPQFPPVVYVSSNSEEQPIRPHHPIVDSSGATASPYLLMWSHPRSNLSDLVHNLVNLFSHDHPFYFTNSFSYRHSAFVSKMEAIDRLYCAVHYDLAARRAKTGEETEELLKTQAEMVNRVDSATSIMIGLQEEKEILMKIVEEVTDQADVLTNWLRVNDHTRRLETFDDAFEAADEVSRVVIDCVAADRAVEDVMFALDKAVEEGVVRFGVYIKQVRRLAAEQFFHRATLVKLKACDYI